MRKNLHSKLMLLLAAVLMGVGSVSAADKWVKTAPADLQTGDIVVIVDQTSGTAMPNNNGTSSAPAATVVTLSTDKSEITGDVASTLQWEVTVSNGSYQFGVGEDFLYCIGQNNGVRVGSNDNNAFTIYDNDGVDFMLNTGTNRYIGVYNNQDWRCYTSINSNINNSVTAFYKKTTASGPVDATVTISSESIPVGQTATISGPERLSISYESSNTQVATVDQDGTVTGIAAGKATITATWSATNEYNAGSEEFTVTVVEATVYEKVTSTTQLVAGNEYILVATDNNAAMGAQGGNIRSAVDVTIANNKVAITTEEVTVLTLGGSTDAWTFLDSDNDLYLAYSGSSNQVHTSDDATANASKWIITDDFKLESSNVNGRVLQYNYNNGNPRFACYATNQKPAVLFVKSGSATDSRTQPELSWSAEEVSIDLGATQYERPYLVNTNQLEVTVTSDNEDVAYYTPNGIMVNTNAAGTATLTATFEGNDNYLPATATCTITVVDNRTEAEIAWDPSEIEIEVGAQDYTQPQFVNTNQVEVTFTSTDEQNASYTPNGLMVNTSVAGTYTITATFAGNSQYLPTTAELTITVVAPDVPVVPARAGVGCFVKVTDTQSLTAGQYLVVYEGESVAFDGSLESLDAAHNNISVTIVGDKIDATEDNVAAVFTIKPSAGTIQSASGYYIGVTSYGNGLKTSENASAYDNDFSIDDSGNATISKTFSNGDMILNFNANKNDKRFRYYKDGSQQDIQLYKYDETVEFSAPITVTDAGWATYIAERNVKFPAAVSAYIATSFNEATSSVTLKKVEAVNQGTPVIVKAEAGTYPLENAVIVNNVEDNLLVVYRASKGLDYGYNPFVLAKNDGKACFKQWVGNKTDIDGRVVLPLKLDLNSPNAVRALTIVFSDTTTGIETVGNAISTMDNGAYTLSGQRVQKPTKGLYIIGGKKVVVK